MLAKCTCIISILIASLPLIQVCHAQIAGDPTPLEWLSFRSQVLRHHPLSKQADLYRSQAAAGLLQARGHFDPKVYADFSAKNFNGKNYFQHTESGLKWPTVLGLEVKGAFNYATGDYLNPESALPQNGQAVFGFNWTLGQGLFIDERRAVRLQAQTGIQQAEALRTALLNDLLFDAAKAYWTWSSATNSLRIYEEALNQAQIRHEAVRESFLQGDKPAIDTLETYIQVQNRLLDVNFARTDSQNAMLDLRIFLWEADNIPVAPEQKWLAPDIQSGEFMQMNAQKGIELAQKARLQHPEIILGDAKLRNLDVERRLKREKQKPVFDLEYNLLGAGWQFFPTVGTEGAAILANDIKWGVHFSYPLLNRKARGDLQITEAKIARIESELNMKRQSFENKVQHYVNELNNLSRQIALFRELSANYRVLLAAEIEKFNFGESTAFLINTREQRWLETQIKLLKLLAEYRKTEAGALWSAGMLAE